MIVFVAVLHSLQSETCRIVWNSIIDVTLHVAKGSSWFTYLRFKCKPDYFL